MTTALSVYATQTAATTVTTAANMANALSGTGVGIATTLGTATGWGELYGLGTTNAWGAGGAIGSPSGNGCLWDVTTLEGQQIIAGSWTSSVILWLSQTATITADIELRFYKRSSGGTSTSIGTTTLTGQTLNTTHTTYTLPSASLSAANFSTGDKLYVDVWLNVTANSNGVSALKVNLGVGSATGGVASRVEVDTPGYQVGTTTSTRTMTATAALQTTSTRTISATAALQTTNTRTIGAVAAVQTTNSRTIPATAALAKQRSIPATAALQVTSTRTISATGALSTTSTRTMTATAALQTTNKRTIAALASLTLSSTRTIPASVALQVTNTRTIVATAALLVTNSRTLPAAASLSVPLNYAQYHPLLATRLTFLLPPLIRTAAPSVSWWCPSGVAGTYDFTNPNMQEWLWVFDQAQSMGSTVLVAVNSPSPFASTDASFATAFSDLLNYLVNTLGYTNIRYVSGLSEPDTNGATYTQYKTTIEPNLVAALAANTLTNAVTLLGPDTAMAEDSWLTSASTDLSSTLGGYVRHAFPTGASDISNDSRETTVKSLISGIYTADPTNKPVIQGEMGFAYMGPGQAVATFQYGLEMTDYAVQLLRAGMAAPIAYILDDDMHGTQWGFWQITQDTGMPRPWFFPWSLLTQTLVPGSTLYAPVQPDTNDLRVLAAQSPQGAWTFVVVNRRNASQQIQLSIPFAQVATTTLQQYVYSSSAPLIVDSNGFPLPSGTITAVLARGFTVPMAANSVLILSQQTTAQTTIFDVKRPPLQKRR